MATGVPAQRTPETRAAAQKRAAKTLTEQERGYLAALESERQGYVTRGLPKRAAEVDAEIRRVKGEDK